MDIHCPKCQSRMEHQLIMPVEKREFIPQKDISKGVEVLYYSCTCGFKARTEIPIKAGWN